MKSRYTFNLVQRTSVVMQGHDPHAPVDVHASYNYLRAIAEGESDAEALTVLRERYPESGWRLVNLYSVEPLYTRDGD